MEEVWKDVVGYEDLFMVSNIGNIYSKRSNKVLKQQLHPNGYNVLSTKIGGRNGVCKCFKIHRLVAEAFLEKPSEELILEASNTVYGLVIVNHRDGVKTNNCVNNLEWSSYKENSIHAYKNNLQKPLIGAKSASSFFKSEEHREAAYKDFILSGLSMRKYAKLLGVNHQVISRLVRDYG